MRLRWCTGFRHGKIKIKPERKLFAFVEEMGLSLISHSIYQQAIQQAEIFSFTTTANLGKGKILNSEPDLPHLWLKSISQPACGVLVDFIDSTVRIYFMLRDMEITFIVH